MKRLTYVEAKKVCDSLTRLETPVQPYENDPHWWRMGENERYAYESNSFSGDNRIIDKKRNNQEVWSYYKDFYTG